MDFKNDVDDLEGLKKLPPNIARLNLENETQDKAKIMICPSIIKMASDIFTKDLLNYAKRGGDMKSLTVNNVYPKENNSSDLCWTSEKVCDMCVDENKN